MKIVALFLLGMFFMVNSCTSAEHIREAISLKDINSYTFSLITAQQEYEVTKKDGEFELFAITGFFLTDRSIPTELQEFREVRMERHLSHDEGSNFEERLQTLIDASAEDGDNSLHAEGITNSMHLFIPVHLTTTEGLGSKQQQQEGILEHQDYGSVSKSREYKWNSNLTCVGNLYAGLNEYLFSLMPDLKLYPASFPFSQSPPGHINEDTRSSRLGGEIGDSPIVRLGGLKAIDGRAENNELLYAAYHGDIKRIRHALQNGADINSRNGLNCSPLFLAILTENENAVELLISQGADINLQNNRGVTPILLAASCDHSRIVELLIRKGAIIKIPDDVGSTVLHKAARRGNKDMVRLLIDNGADVSVPDIAGKTPLHFAVCASDIEIVRILLKAGANIDAVAGDGSTPLMLAASEGTTEIISFLIAGGASVDNKNCVGWTLLHFAARNADSKPLRYLLDSGLPINATAEDGRTALHVAISCGNVEVAAFLLERGCPINAKIISGPQRGKTALDLAQESGNMDCIRLFKLYSPK